MKKPGRGAQRRPDAGHQTTFSGPDTPRSHLTLECSPDGTIIREHRDDLHHHDAHHFGAGRILYTAVEPLTGAGARAIQGGVPGSEAEGPISGGTVYADVIKETGLGPQRNRFGR
jgi:hypothetical protein